MDPKGIFEALQTKFGEDNVFEFRAEENPALDSWFFVNPDQLVPIAEHLRNDPELSFSYLECISGIDYLDKPLTGPPSASEEEPEKGTIHVVYHVYSYLQRHRAIFKISLPRDKPTVATLCSVWSAANWQERECYDLFGVEFTGHPDLRRVLLPDDWVGFPLRKDYKEQPEYHGIPTTREDPLVLLAPPKPPKPDKKAPSEAAKDKKAPAGGKADAKKDEAKPDAKKDEAKPDTKKDEAKPDKAATDEKAES